MPQIQKFWKWFQANENQIKYAVQLGINSQEVFNNLSIKLGYVSKRIGCLISSLENEEKYLIIFTCGGYRKLFSKVTALEREAPCLDLFIPQAFIRPMNEPQILEQREESFFTFPHYELKMSEVQFTIVNYNTTSKKISIEIAIHNL